jgi:hypothetical protein
MNGTDHKLIATGMALLLFFKDMVKDMDEKANKANFSTVFKTGFAIGAISELLKND